MNPRNLVNIKFPIVAESEHQDPIKNCSKRSVTSWILPLIFTIVSYTAAFAQCDVQPNQLVNNCDFAVGTKYWSSNRGVLSHSNAVGNNAIGSLQCQGEVAGSWVWCQPAQCIPVAPNTTYGVGYHAQLTSPPPNGGDVIHTIRYQEGTDTNCSTLLPGSFQASGFAVGSDSSFQTLTSTITTGGSTNSILLELRTLNQNGNAIPGDIYTTHYDDVFFGIGMVPVELQSFTID